MLATKNNIRRDLLIGILVGAGVAILVTCALAVVTAHIYYSNIAR